MATNDVPGANPANRDDLHEGCWAEHQDGSLIHVLGYEGSGSDPRANVVFQIYDLSKEPVVFYQDAMPLSGFQREFSWKPTGSSRVKWTWHDKTSFPFDRVMRRFTPGATHADVQDTMTAAQRIAESLGLRARTLHEADVREQQPTHERRGRSIADRIGRAIQELVS